MSRRSLSLSHPGCREWIEAVLPRMCLSFGRNLSTSLDSLGVPLSSPDHSVRPSHARQMRRTWAGLAPNENKVSSIFLRSVAIFFDESQLDVNCVINSTRFFGDPSLLVRLEEISLIRHFNSSF